MSNLRSNTADLLSASEVSKIFDGVYALKKVNFDLKAGEVHALLGANGAGKSTLIKILSGVYEKDAGEIEIDGRQIRTHDVATVFQELSLVPSLTVWQNIFLCNEIYGPLGILKKNEMQKMAGEILDRLGLHLESTAMVSDLSIAEQQLVEIAKAVHREAQVLILDEPTSTLTKSDQVMLFERIENIKKSGVGIIYVTHRLNEVFEIADRVTVIRDGSTVLTTEASELSMEQLVFEISGSGRQAKKQIKTENAKTFLATDPLLKISKLSGDRFSNLNLEVKPGEIVGIAGLIGSGRTEFLETIAGIRKRTDGDIYLDKTNRIFKNPSEALRAGIALVPEDRRLSGLIMSHSIKLNIILAHQNEAFKFGVNKSQASTSITKRLVEAFNIKISGITSAVNTLSGGNQQKVVFAKWMQPKVRVLLLDEPTQGVDVGARQEIYEAIRRFAAGGAGVVVVSSDFTELHDLCDRLHFMTPQGLSESEIVVDEMTEQYINTKLNERV